LGHLIPAGTGFRTFQDSEVSYRREAVEDLVNRGYAAMEETYPLLQNPAPGDDQPDPSADSTSAT
jgi:DNA-directed RNA polymerase subunit beta'